MVESARVLIADAEGAHDLLELIAARGFDARLERSLATVEACVEAHDVDLVFVELRPDAAFELIREHAERSSDVPIIAVAPTGAPEAGARALTLGAAEWIARPLDGTDVSSALARTLERARAAHGLPPKLGMPGSRLLGASREISRVREAIATFAPTDTTVLVLGETGSGKELVARSLHEQSSRRAAPFTAVNLAAIPHDLVEADLFGYARGAFTGAFKDTPGRIELAKGGTIFLDEIGDVSASVQVKLLRLLQDGDYSRVGDVTPRSSEARVVAATHRPLQDMVHAGTFREDLYYRLNVATIWVPPLRARRGDVPELVRAIMENLAARSAHAVPRSVNVADSALRALEAETWPGNVRQLQNFVQRLVLEARGPTLTGEDVRRELQRRVSFVSEVIPPSAQAASAKKSGTASSSAVHLSEEVRAAEKHAIEKALSKSQGNKSRAARLLDISRATLYEKLATYGIEA